MDNMHLWNQWCQTDPRMTKPAKTDGRDITTLAPQLQKKRATEVLGPCGIGWWVESPRFEFFCVPGFDKTVALFTGMLHYVLDGKEGKHAISSSETIAYHTRGSSPYPKVDGDFAKKMQTDATTKGFADLGMNSDVFEGKFDDNKYVQAMREQFSEPNDTQPKDSLFQSAEYIALKDAYKAKTGITDASQFKSWATFNCEKDMSKGGNWTPTDIKTLMKVLEE